ncbi:mucin-1-like [Bacillus rossius redtenbacheri]|uniref:mucin-1-like n=1 Tax=Bacillus rossius redtenbacheri TaxID=93214 RepID=UPI002FDCABF2
MTMSCKLAMMGKVTMLGKVAMSCKLAITGEVAMSGKVAMMGKVGMPGKVAMPRCWGGCTSLRESAGGRQHNTVARPPVWHTLQGGDLVTSWLAPLSGGPGGPGWCGGRHQGPLAPRRPRTASPRRLVTPARSKPRHHLARTSQWWPWWSWVVRGSLPVAAGTSSPEDGFSAAPGAAGTSSPEDGFSAAPGDSCSLKASSPPGSHLSVVALVVLGVAAGTSSPEDGFSAAPGDSCSLTASSPPGSHLSVVALVVLGGAGPRHHLARTSQWWPWWSWVVRGSLPVAAGTSSPEDGFSAAPVAAGTSSPEDGFSAAPGDSCSLKASSPPGSHLSVVALVVLGVAAGTSSPEDGFSAAPGDSCSLKASSPPGSHLSVVALVVLGGAGVATRGRWHLVARGRLLRGAWTASPRRLVTPARSKPRHHLARTSQWWPWWSWVVRGSPPGAAGTSSPEDGFSAAPVAAGTSSPEDGFSAAPGDSCSLTASSPPGSHLSVVALVVLGGAGVATRGRWHLVARGRLLRGAW